MIDNITAINTLKHLTLFGASTVAGGVSLSVQLQERHQYMYLQLPLWVFLVATVVLIFAGAFVSMLTDAMQSETGKVGQFLTAFSVGIIVTFVFLPLVVAEPNPLYLMLTGVVSSFSGTVLLYLLTKVVTDEVLHQSILDIVTTGIRESVTTIVTRVSDAIKAFFGGGR